MPRACEGIDVVFHEAALGSIQRSIEDPATTMAINVGGTVNLLAGARDAGSGAWSTLPLRASTATGGAAEDGKERRGAALALRRFESDERTAGGGLRPLYGRS